MRLCTIANSLKNVAAEALTVCTLLSTMAVMGHVQSSDLQFTSCLMEAATLLPKDLDAALPGLSKMQRFERSLILAAHLAVTHPSYPSSLFMHANLCGFTGPLILGQLPEHAPQNLSHSSIEALTLLSISHVLKACSVGLT